MDLFQEYAEQQKWRNWEAYLPYIPLKNDDSILDLGCSLGAVSRMFSSRVRNVTGIDIRPEFIEFCDSNKKSNEKFICSNLLDVDYSSLVEIDGVWASFSLSYFSEPLTYLRSLNASMKEDGWIALLDVSCFISGNLAKDSRYYEMVRKFELDSCKTGLYDFDFGSKMQTLLVNAGFMILHSDHNVTDAELNFSGVASNEVVRGWLARLGRMKKLQQELGSEYHDFCNEFIDYISSEAHEKRGNVRFVVAKKNLAIQTTAKKSAA